MAFKNSRENKLSVGGVGGFRPPTPPTDTPHPSKSQRADIIPTQTGHRSR